ncbi:flagellar motor switch protein FliM [Paludicola sp. MB14-C6]|uniref:flagellar motor switch protein FliM n=1 Tax=Paludihabitans sp. MB14-C6 TaxID=3070656 RepID=UPI0027DB1502|nr:flagellar motor switch protein FliM [Paludicola sp. MB14-C6]WMJ24239.1 flagellar motor switch protein FliM [Paludicola sp. MB14-C6]
MAEVLSQKQIDELLGNLQSGGKDINEVQQESKEKKYKEYDFRTPKRITRDQIKLLDSIFENFSRLLALQLSSILRISCEAELVTLEEQQYYEFSNALNDSVLMGIFSLDRKINDNEKQIIMEMARPLSYSIIDRLLGGNGEGYNVDKDYTDIELSIMRYIFEKLASIFTNAWSNYIDVTADYDMIETNSRLIQSIAPDETIVIIIIEVTIRSLKEKINICIPSESLNTIFKSFENKFVRVSKKGDTFIENQRKEFILDSLNEAPLTVTGLLGESEIKLQDLLNLQVGDIIPLGTPVQGNTIQVNVDEHPWFMGVMGVKKKKYAIKIGKVLD